MNRHEICEEIVAAKNSKGLSWRDIAEVLSRPPAWTVAAAQGQHPFQRAEAEKLVELLDLDKSIVEVLCRIPMRGSLPAAIPTDPTIYRFYEAIQVYGPAIKELIHEDFGDGIMSAINFSVSVDKRRDPGGDRVVVTFSGKYLPYEWKE